MADSFLHAPDLFSRRDLLKVGSISLAGTLMPEAWARADSDSERHEATARSVIVLWMAGGVTHIDSFDPKPDAPEEIRGTLSTIPTTLPGVRFTEVMPCLARMTDRIAVLRSFAHDSNDHFVSQAYALSGRRVAPNQILTEPNVGAVVARLHGARASLPGYIAVPGTTRPGPPPTNLFTGGWLGRHYSPFGTGGNPRNEDFTARVQEPDEEDFHRQCLQAPTGMNEVRLGDRQTLQVRLDAQLRALDANPQAEALAQQYQGAFAMLTSQRVRQAFELRQEPRATRERYGLTKIGQRCLLARRLVEAGARFVLVDYGYDPEYGNLWDNHRAPVQNQPHICDMAKLPHHLAGTDRGCAALVEDLCQRGLLEDTLVVFLTEFGRTPRINREGGRDHWGNAGSLFFAGGGVQGGQVIGATDRHAANPTGVRHGPWDVAATIYRAIGIDPETILYDRQHRPIPVLPQGEVIAGMFS